LAELSAWDIIKNQPKNRNLELVTILPGLVIGPLLSKTGGGSSRTLITRFLNPDHFPVIPELNICLVDVRDVATAHIRALTSPSAVGNRYICSSRSMWLSEISQVLHSEFSNQGFKIPKMILPNFLVWFASWWDSDIAAILPLLGQEMKFNNEKIIKDLDIEFHSVEKSIIEMAYNIIKLGFISDKQ